MRLEEFSRDVNDLGKMVVHFTPDEITSTGASLESVQLPLMLKMDQIREAFGIPIRLLHNGLTTGNHKSSYHPRGLACDFYFLPSRGFKIDPYQIFKGLIRLGLVRIGIYYVKETGIYTFHIDLGKEVAFWHGTKQKKGDPWTFGQLIQDPAKLVL